MVKTKLIPGVEVNGSVHLFRNRQRHQHIRVDDVTNHGAVVERVWDTNGNTYVQFRGEKTIALRGAYTSSGSPSCITSFMNPAFWWDFLFDKNLYYFIILSCSILIHFRKGKRYAHKNSFAAIHLYG